MTMSNAPAFVDCPECGKDFDPSAAGGWCTNPECGEYRHETETSDESTETQDEGDATGGSTDSGTVECPQCNQTVPDQNFCKECGAEIGDNTADSSSTNEQNRPNSQSSTSDVGDSSGTDAGHPTADAEAQSSETSESPSVSESSGTADGDDKSSGDGSAEKIEQDDSLDTCPNCGEDVEENWSACPFCEENLEQHRTDTAEAESTTQNDPVPDTVIVEVGGSEIVSEDGDGIGSEVRTAYVANGGDSDEAQLISREHVRFVREDDRFSMINKGTNETKLNGELLDDDEKRELSEGDEIDFAGATTGTVSFE